MTGFATLAGEAEGWTWAWDLRSVNARGLDIRLRLPDWIEGLDQPVRAALSKVVARGNVTLGLRVTRSDVEASETIDQDALSSALDKLREIQTACEAANVVVTPPSALDILNMRGVVANASKDEDTAPLVKALIAQLPELLGAFADMRATEGRALDKVLGLQMDEIESLTQKSAQLAEARKDVMSAKLKENLARVLDSANGADPDRVAQELALITVKADVTEEIDRLHAHVSAARELLASDAPIGRKLDFLSQEFNREANTLCSKAQANDLTRVGLDLKAVIDQMREQVQNVE